MSSKQYFTTSKFVKELSPKDFDSVVSSKLKSGECTAILFYANYCPWCHKMKDAWEEFAEMAAFYNVAAFDCATHTAHSAKIKDELPLLSPPFQP